MTNYTFEYLPRRGVSKTTLQFYDCKTAIGTDGKPVAVRYRYPGGWYKIRNLVEKDFRTEGPHKGGLYGRDKFAAGCSKFIVLTEGEEDAHSYYQVLRNVPVCSVQSSGSAHRDCSVDWDYLNSFERIYLAFDNDLAGRAAVREVAKLFDYNKIFIVKFSNRKDANEYLQAGEDDVLVNLWSNAKKYLPDDIISSLDDFEKIVSEPPKWGVPFPFKTLTDMTYGLRKGETYLFTAKEGVGKTELMHAIEYKLLTETDENVAGIFLEEPKKRHLEALAGIRLRNPVHLPDTSCTRTEVARALKEVIRLDDRLHIYSHFGSDDPDVFLDTVRFLVSARGCGYVIVDHLTMVVSGLAGEDERRALDYLSTRLEMMVQELGYCLILVSHVNDFGETRGSRYIGKICHTRIDLKRDTMSDDPVEKNTTYFTIPKNRFGMRTGSAGKVLFDPALYTFTEIAEDSHVGTLQAA